MSEFFQYGEKEINYLRSKDEKLAKLIDAAGHLDREVKDDLFTSLVDSIMGQQISTAAHITLKKRIREKFGTLTPQKTVRLTDEELKSIGISWRKTGYIKKFAEKVVSGEFDIDSLYSMSDEDVIEALVSLNGVGQWTAEMILTFTLKRKDVISYGDLGIRRGIMKLYNLDELSKSKFHEITDKFAPYRTVAALYYWHYANPSCTLDIE